MYLKAPAKKTFKNKAIISIVLALSDVLCVDAINLRLNSLSAIYVRTLLPITCQSGYNPLPSYATRRPSSLAFFMSTDI